MQPRTRAAIRRSTMLFTSLAMAGSLLAVGAAPTFAATATPPSSCSWGDVWYGIDTVSKPYLVTHKATVSVAPGSTYSESTALTTVNSITASVTGSISGSVEANAIIAKAGAKVGFTLKVSGTKTVSSTLTYSWTLTNTGSTQKRYVLYTAPHKVTGTYTKWQCDRFEVYKKVTNGSFTSFDSEVRGSALCGYSYAAGTDEKTAQAYC
jgi:hypothetical protein